MPKANTDDSINPATTLSRLREKAADQVERLLAFLDEVDGYSTNELEEAADDIPCDDLEIEPSLGWTGAEASRGQHATSADIDVEFDNCDDEDADQDGGDDPDHEPSLGWPENVTQRVSPGGSDDRELERHSGMSARKAAQLRSHIPSFSNLRTLRGGRVIL